MWTFLKCYNIFRLQFREVLNEPVFLWFWWFCCSPSGEKKVLEQKAADINGYQIRVWKQILSCLSDFYHAPVYGTTEWIKLCTHWLAHWMGHLQLLFLKHFIQIFYMFFFFWFYSNWCWHCSQFIKDCRIKTKMHFCYFNPMWSFSEAGGGVGGINVKIHASRLDAVGFFCSLHHYT